MNDERIMGLLARAVNAETFAIKLYINISKNLKGLDMAAVAGDFMEVAEGEMHHLAKLMDFQAGLGGVPFIPSMTVPIPHGIGALEDGLRESIQAEEDGIEIYKEGRRLGEECDYIPLVILCENFLLEEEEHRQEFIKLLAGIIPPDEDEVAMSAPSQA